GVDDNLGGRRLRHGCRLEAAERRDQRGGRPAQRKDFLQGARAQCGKGAGADGGRAAGGGGTDGGITPPRLARPAGRQARRSDRAFERGDPFARPRRLIGKARRKSLAGTFTTRIAPAYTPGGATSGT